MNPKLIFLDIDGTLTPAGSNVPPDSALEAIRAAQKNGHKVALCSGRNYAMLEPLLHYGFDGVIASAGGYVEWNGTAVYDCPMTPEQQEKSMRVFAESGIFRTVESRIGSYTDEGFKVFIKEHAKDGANSELLRWREQLESSLNILPMAEFKGEPIYKLIFMSPSEELLDTPRRLLGNEFDFCIQDTNEIGVVNGELINRCFNKGTAVRLLCKAAGIPLEDSIAFGDSMNDLEMMQTAALSICMANGSETLKKESDEICPAVEDDGLFKAFKKHGLMD